MNDGISKFPNFPRDVWEWHFFPKKKKNRKTKKKKKTSPFSSKKCRNFFFKLLFKCGKLTGPDKSPNFFFFNHKILNQNIIINCIPFLTKRHTTKFQQSKRRLICGFGVQMFLLIVLSCSGQKFETATYMFNSTYNPYMITVLVGWL